uniref:Reverse transcriptase zinc-binding domain-containing protein n=1 Tax=Cannabis sativa TaxID=3483 RepID=A0A803QIF3_CANSA
MVIAGEGSLYLGLPSTLSRNKSAVLGYLKERVRKKVEGWEMKFLSRAGKEVLIKTVAQSLPSYAMSVFLLPLDITRDMEKTMNKFWWQGSNKAKNGIHWFSWDRLCMHKSKGGMGFRSLRDFNLSMLGKQGWRLMTRPNSLVAKVFKARYFPNGTFFSAELGNNPSFVWRSLLEAQDLVRKGTRWCVGSGEDINVLHEPWLPCEEQPFIESTHPGLLGSKVCNLMEVGGGSWDKEILDDLFEERDKKLILDIPLHSTQGRDKLHWIHETSGFYSVKSAYKLLQKVQGRWQQLEDEQTKFWTKFWRLKIPPKVKNLVWRAGRECLPTLKQLRLRRVDVQALCPICRVAEESIEHALLLCTQPKLVWDRRHRDRNRSHRSRSNFEPVHPCICYHDAATKEAATASLSMGDMERSK